MGFDIEKRTGEIEGERKKTISFAHDLTLLQKHQLSQFSFEENKLFHPTYAITAPK